MARTLPNSFPFIAALEMQSPKVLAMNNVFLLIMMFITSYSYKMFLTAKQLILLIRIMSKKKVHCGFSAQDGSKVRYFQILSYHIVLSIIQILFLISPMLVPEG